MSNHDLMQKIVSLCKRRGFVFQSSEIYGGLKSAYDYGPLGVELKRNLMNLWWRDMVHSREDVVGLDASIMMHPKVWHASGHLSGFSDPLVDCLICKERFRVEREIITSIVANTVFGVLGHCFFAANTTSPPQALHEKGAASAARPLVWKKEPVLQLPDGHVV